MKQKLTFPPKLAQLVVDLATRIQAAGGRAYCVGGAVRDGLLGIPIKDVDIEVFGLSYKAISDLLQQDYRLDFVGKAFGIIKLRGQPIDIAIPRTEGKQGRGHKGFWVKPDPELTVEQGAQRRDFTINAIYWDPLTEELVDPARGRRDLNARILRHVSDQFSEDPLRVLRAMQFIARFELEVAPETLSICQQINPEGLSPERFFEEWKKLLIKGLVPSMGLEFLRLSGWVYYFPELERLIHCEQDPEWHPEGSVWNHTLLCLDAFARERTGDEQEDLIVGLAVLCHDIGKPDTTITDEAGRIRSPKHDVIGVHVAKRFLKSITRHKELTEAVTTLVKAHMRPVELYKIKASDSAVRRLARFVGRIDRLLRVVSADMQGCGDGVVGKETDAIEWLRTRAEALRVASEKPKPIVLGRHLIARELKPGPVFSELIDQCFQAQLDGQFHDLDGGLAFLDKLLKR